MLHLDIDHAVRCSLQRSVNKEQPAGADVMAALKPCCLSLPFFCIAW